MGEIIWTPVAEKVIHVKEKYRSASSVTAVELTKLQEQLHAEEICMIFLLIERLAEAKDTARLERYRTRLSGALDFYSLAEENQK